MLSKKKLTQVLEKNKNFPPSTTKTSLINSSTPPMSSIINLSSIATTLSIKVNKKTPFFANILQKIWKEILYLKNNMSLLTQILTINKNCCLQSFHNPRLSTRKTLFKILLKNSSATATLSIIIQNMRV